MAKNPPDERLVYLALKNTFKGQDAQLRTPKKIRKLIEKRLDGGDAEVNALIAEYNIDNICNTTKTLLRDGVFASTLKAKIRFPEVFEVSPAQSADRAASEAEAARSDEHAIRDATRNNLEKWTALETTELELMHESKGKEPGIRSQAFEFLLIRVEFKVSTPPPRLRSCSCMRVSVPSLYPIYLPLHTQHRLLVKVQGILEDACYAFGQNAMGDTLQREGWDCPESVELNVWARVFRHNEEKFESKELLELGKPFPKFLDSIAQLRHTAVHRVPVSANKVKEFIVDAESLAKILHDNISIQVLSRIRRDAQQIIDDLGRNKDLLESVLKDKLQAIDAQRRELDNLQSKMIEDMLREDRQFQNLASANLKQTISEPGTFPLSEFASDHETSSETEVEVHTFRILDSASAGESASSSSKLRNMIEDE